MLHCLWISRLQEHTNFWKCSKEHFFITFPSIKVTFICNDKKYTYTVFTVKISILAWLGFLKMIGKYCAIFMTFGFYSVCKLLADILSVAIFWGPRVIKFPIDWSRKRLQIFVFPKRATDAEYAFIPFISYTLNFILRTPCKCKEGQKKALFTERNKTERRHNLQRESVVPEATLGLSMWP